MPSTKMMTMMLTGGGKLPTNDAHPRQFWLITLPPCPMLSPCPTNIRHQEMKIFSRILFHFGTPLSSAEPSDQHKISKGMKLNFMKHFNVSWKNIVLAQSTAPVLCWPTNIIKYFKCSQTQLNDGDGNDKDDEDDDVAMWWKNISIKHWKIAGFQQLYFIDFSAYIH